MATNNIFNPTELSLLVATVVRDLTEFDKVACCQEHVDLMRTLRNIYHKLVPGKKMCFICGTEKNSKYIIPLLRTRDDSKESMPTYYCDGCLFGEKMMEMKNADN
jgi:hypothetical protein